MAFFSFAFFHSFQTALFFKPFEDFAADVDAVAWRCIVQGSGICLCFVFKHGRSAFHDIVADQILTDDDDDYAGRSDIFLNAAVDHAVFCNIHRLRQETRGHVGYQCFALGIWKGFELGSVNGVVSQMYT